MPTNIAVLGIDLGKDSCSAVGRDGTGQVVLRRRMRRGSVIRFAAGQPRCGVAMKPAAARIVWAVLRHGGTYRANFLMAA